MQYDAPTHITTPEEFFGQRDQTVERSSTASSEEYKLALEVRKFEIELYWKRATYFWAFVAAAITGYIAMRTSSNAVSSLSILVAALGFYVTAAWWLASRGSKYWQENWEAHVAMREDTAGALFSTVLNPTDAFNPIGAYPYSVSKINAMISIAVMAVWIGLIIDYWRTFGLNHKLLACVVLVVVGIVLLLCCGRSSVTRIKQVVPKQEDLTFVRRLIKRTQ